MLELNIDNALLRDMPGDPESGSRVRQVEAAAWSRVAPTPVREPSLVIASEDMLQALGWTPEQAQQPVFSQIMAGNELLSGMQPWASAYGGHQFGHWAGQLGDGRAISLCEALGVDGQRWELQLKGAGPTPYSRNADGRAVLRSSLREFMCSEAMFHLGVPTTRALSLVLSGEQVTRDMFYDGHPRAEPGALVCRMAPSFTRFGHFELPASRGDRALLRQWLDFTRKRDFPHIEGNSAEADELLFREVCERTALLLAHWMRVGFVHGVMNTDNMSILGLTIDYGPYGWMDNFDADWTPNTTDAQGRRYRFGTQPQIAHWNLGRLAGALSLLFEDHAPLQAGLDHYAACFQRHHAQMSADKLGLSREDPEAVEFMSSTYQLLQDAELDMSLFFRLLAELDTHATDPRPLQAASYSAQRFQNASNAISQWLREWGSRARASGESDAQRQTRMNATNPRYVPRNYLAQLAIDRAEQGDYSLLHELMAMLRQPYTPQPEHEQWAAKRPEWARQRPGCSMLSCSS